MHTVEILNEALSLAAQLGYRVRQEWLEGDGGGLCIVRGERWLFVDLAQPPAEQLGCVAKVLRGNQDFSEVQISRELAGLINSSRNPPAVAGLNQRV